MPMGVRQQGPGAASFPCCGFFMQVHVSLITISACFKEGGMERGSPLLCPERLKDPQLLDTLLGASEGKTAILIVPSRYVSGLASAPD